MTTGVARNFQRGAKARERSDRAGEGVGGDLFEISSIKMAFFAH